MLLRYRSSVRKTGLTTLTFNLLIKVLLLLFIFGRVSRCLRFGSVFEVDVIVIF